MAEPDDVETLNQQIRDGSPKALETLAAIDSPCIVDADGQSPFNVAIEIDNEEVIGLLLDVDEAREFAPDVHTADAAKFIKMIYRTEGIDDIELAESRALKPAGTPAYWQRTPLLQACRFRNLDAIHELVARGAKLTAKDLVGETALSLCLKSGGTDLARHFIESCIDAKKPFSLTEEILWTLCRDKELYEKAVTHGRPGAVAKRFAFNLACAQLDRPAIEKMLDDGFDVNSATTDDTNPLLEIVTARLAWLYQAAGWERLAAGYAHFNGHPETTSISIPNDPGPDDLTFGQVQALHAKLNKALSRKEINPKFMSADVRRKRLELIDLLLEKGLDSRKINKNRPFMQTSDVVSSNEPELAAALSDARISLAPDGDIDIEYAIRHGCFDMVAVLKKCGHKLTNKRAIPKDMLKKFRKWEASGEAAAPPLMKSPRTPLPEDIRETYWELTGESVLLASVSPDPARGGEECTIRLRHSNVYGPCPDVQFEIQVNETNWQAVELVGETVCVDDVEVELASLDEPPVGETPWTAVFELKMTLPRGTHRVMIRVSGPDSNYCVTLDDWRLEVGD